ncbi:MAG: SEL1-like repeat protein [Selenomonadaceae bacterium]|nr:SEL1-like repeat protein [Selenomonadaceae bacterium]
MNEDDLRSEINRMYTEADELESRAKENHALAQKIFRQLEETSSAEMSAQEIFDLTFLACDADVESIKFEMQAAKLHEKIFKLEVEFYDLKKLPPIGKEFKHSGGVSSWEMQEFWNKKDKIDLRDNLFKAHNGNVEAMRNLGDCFYFGRGTFTNLDRARYWYERAAARGDDFAKTKLEDSYGVDTSPSPFPQFDPSSADLPAFDYTPPKKTQPLQKKSAKKKKSSTSSVFSSKKKKPRYDGNFGEVDPVLADLYNSEDYGREDHTVVFGDENYNADKYKSSSDTYRKPKRSKYFGGNNGDDDDFDGGGGGDGG